MKRALSVSLLLLVFPAILFAQGVSCPAVVASPDTTLNCNDCVLLRATPVSGYTTTTYTTQSIPYNPYPFNTGTSILVAADDEWGPVVNLPFNFCFYGNNYTQCQAGSNGLVSFDLYPPNSYCTWPISAPIPDPLAPLNCIMGPWHDINPSFGGTVFTQLYGVAPCRVFVVSWENNAMFSCTNITTTQQVAIYETTNIVEVYIRDKPLCATWNGGASILGVHNATGTQAVVVPGRNYPTQWSATNEGWRFVPAGTPNYTVSWFESGNPVPLTNLDTITVCPSTPTDYYAEVIYTNCNGATVTVRDTASIIASASNMVLTMTQTDAVCNGSSDGTATVGVTGNNNPYTILWSDNQTTATATGLAAGTYTVTVTETGGCLATSSVTINEPLAIVLQASHTDAICNGQPSGTASVTATNAVGALSYNWSNGGTTQTITGLGIGTYNVTVTDANGCTATASTTVGQPVPVVVSLQATDPLCAGQPSGTATATGSAGVGSYTYLWSNGANTQTATGLTAGTYSVTATDANGCQATGSISLVDPSPIVVGATSTNAICFAGSEGTATAQVSGGTPPYTYQWNNGGNQVTINNLPAGSYTVTATDANGCSGSATVAVTEPPIISLQVIGDSSLCEYDSVRLSPVISGGVAPYTYQWISIPTAVNSTSQNLVYVAGDTRNYILTITDANGCVVSASREVISHDAPIVGFYPHRAEACDTVTIYFTNTTTPSNSSFAWEFSDGGSSAYPDPSHFFGNGIWSVGLTATTGEGCTASAYAQDLITVLPTPVASFVSDPNLTLLDYRLLSEATFTFNNNSPWYATTVDWSFGNGDSAHVGQVTYTYADTGYYCVTMTAYNDFGCHDDSTQCVLIRQDPFLWVPTGFTPNGDGLNDVFLISGLEIVEFQVEIFDRWGKMIFFSDVMTTGWDGRALGEAAPEGAYAFKIQATNSLGQKVTRAGTITLVR
jgi:gliding motility-associated-like protein